MITPNQFDTWPGALEELARQLETHVIGDIIRRIKKEGYLTSTAYQQIETLVEFNGLEYGEIVKRLAQFSGIAEKELGRLYQEAVQQLIDDERYVYEALSLPTRLEDNAIVQQLIEATKRQTLGDFRNITASLGFAIRRNGTIEYLPVARAYQHILNEAVFGIQSGGIDPATSVRNAVRQLTDSGLRTVRYERVEGSTTKVHLDQVDVAVRRAVVTGMHQISDQMTAMQMEELGTGLTEVSAHSGARDKHDDYRNHKKWQGGIYWIGTPVEGYESFVDITGYGDVQGYGGANCRHSRRPYIEGVSIPMKTPEELANIDPPDFEDRGKIYNASDARDRRREIERTIRKYKRRIIALEELGIGTDGKEYQKAALHITSWTQEYKRFSEAAGLRQQPERSQVFGYGTGQAARVRAAARKAQG